MIAPPLVAMHHSAPMFQPGASTGECVPKIGAFHAARSAGGPPPAVAVSMDGPYALVAWQWGSGGGMDLFRRSGTTWCRVAVQYGTIEENGRSTPTTWLSTADIAGLPALDGKRAQRLANGPFVPAALGAGGTADVR